MTERKADRVVSIALSILIHAAIVAALAWGWWTYRKPEPTPQTLAIEGTVVRSAQPAPPEPAPPKPVEPPQPTADEQAAQKAKEEEQHKKVEEQHAAEEKHAVEAAAQQQRQHEEADKVAADKAAADKAAADRAEADRKADEQLKAEAARQAKADADKKAQELAQQKKTEQERAQREADLKAQLAAEEHLNAVQASPAKAEYLSLITARINHAWIRPPSARSGVKCTVHITQVPGGVITHVTVTGCNGDESVRQSVETAAYRASPLPAPSDPALFDPNIDVTFAPDE